MVKVLQIGASKKTMGGISTVLKAWENSHVWNKYSCKWIESQDNRNLLFKIYYFIKSFFVSLITIPRYNIIHFHTTPGRSIYVQMPIFILSLLYHKKIIVELHVGNQLNKYIDDKVFNWVLTRADKVVVLAYVWRRFLIDNFFLSDEKVIVLYNPAPVVPAYSDKDHYVLYMAYLVENKGYDIVIEAFSKLIKKYQDWKLIIAGSGEIERAKDLARQNGAEDRIEFRGWVSGSEKGDLWRHAGAYCMASYQEGFPMTVLEAWAYGTPLITTPVGGLIDVLEDGKNALVFPFGDVDELCSCFDKLFSSEELRKHLSDSSKQLVSKMFTMEVISKEIESFYDSLS